MDNFFWIISWLINNIYLIQFWGDFYYVVSSNSLILWFLGKYGNLSI